MTELAGVIPITVTPFDETGRVDEESIATLVEFEIRCGVHGLNVLGIMGEAHKLTDPERQRVAEIFLKHVAGRLPVVVGASHGGTGAVIELSQAAEAAGAAAVMVAPPIGLRGADAILAHYRDVAAAIRIPVVVQDEPVTTGVLMPPELLARIAAEVEGCRYVKLEEPPTPTKTTALRRLPGGDRLRIFGGMNAMYFIEELRRGAAGIMTGFAFPDILVDVYTRFRAGDAAGAAAVYDRYASFIRYEGQQGIGLALRKEVLRRRGAIRTGFVRPPGPRLDDITRAELGDILARMGLLDR
ncbi:MAG: dihydrodipicolinate synthase family protein [Candidatus Rokubacteria bacterium]|nr:dihydrodipicolinate synthase family protein [Candidatus Rokubacteria bacterium]